ncbi:glycosyltransferase family 4 protein [Salinimicrobium sp. HB62]|uniref:glycosyltransferase family 4 protein n=1 Tax=Salinimicrobium sp. HB62 TaxID=3077781 RepID=UPI002D774A20|nr:glycosyltransferase family 4 protein [Salinimicrobium sp. HB62]
MEGKDSVAYFVMPRSSTDWKGAEGLWITTAGWAAAGERIFGESYVLTTDRAEKPSEVVKYPLGKNGVTNTSPLKKMARFFPLEIITFVNDFLLWRTSKKTDNYRYAFPGLEKPVAMVWEQHDFFPGNGYKLAKKFKAPFVIYVHAPQVWESHKWGVKRPFWGKILEKMESRNLKRADAVACVSSQVAEKLESMGVEKKKIIISPMAVDPFLYRDLDTSDIVKEYNLKNKLVIGWTGSFRSFHGVERLVETFRIVKQELANAHLFLVGDGEEMNKIKKLVKEYDIEDAVSFPGRVSFKRMTEFVHVFDVAILSARSASDFHYSPLKLREYLKAGKATLAPNAGEVPQIFTDNVHLKLYELEDIEGTAKLQIDLLLQPQLREELGEAGRQFILENGTWDVELKKVMLRIN